MAVGILKQITDILDAAGMQYAVYDKTVPNPTDKNVAEATEAYKSNGCDSLITLGGGSSHDCGKGVGFVVGQRAVRSTTTKAWTNPASPSRPMWP